MSTFILIFFLHEVIFCSVFYLFVCFFSAFNFCRFAFFVVQYFFLFLKIQMEKKKYTAPSFFATAELSEWLGGGQ